MGVRWFRGRLASAVTFIVLLIAWEVAGDAGLVSRAFFPPPSVVGASFMKLLLNGDLLAAFGATLLRFAIGLFSGALLGAIVGLLMGWWPPLNAFLDPFIAAIYPIPKIAIFPLLLVIFGIGESAKYAAISLSAFFPMLITSLAGVRQINQVYLDVGRNYGARGRRFFFRILLPGSLPSMLAGLRLSANVAFVIAIAVEIVASMSGLGVLLWFAWETFRVSELYAVLVVVAVFGLGVSFAIDRLTRALVPWMGG